MTLSSLGWDDFFAKHFPPFHAAGFIPARVALPHKHAYTLLTTFGAVAGECTGKLLHHAATRADLPAVGDWVAARLRPGDSHATIHAVLPRRTKFSRRAPGQPNDVTIVTSFGTTGAEQIVAANVDTVLLVTALDQNFNLRRIERYLAVAHESGAEPVVVLNKADLAPDPAATVAEVASIARGVPVVALSSLEPNSVTIVTGFGLAGPEEVLRPWLVPGRTLAVLGSSGVGKSTLINRLLGTARQATNAISGAVGKGRHTTTRRELIVAPSGVLVIDTPGMRELQLWDVDSAALEATFDDIAALATRCRFRDCTHHAEPDCAIQAALADGSLDSGRWQSYQKLQREQAYAARRADPRLERENKTEWKKLNRVARDRMRMKGRDV